MSEAKSEPSKHHVTIYTDGGCAPNPGPGGWAAILINGEHRKELKGGELASTNNRMELMAAIAALEALKRPCVVDLHTDSQYLRDGIMSWIKKWKQNGWQLSTDPRKNSPIKNLELWRELDQLAQRHKITYVRILGHSGHPENERCDELAVAAYKKLRG